MIKYFTFFIILGLSMTLYSQSVFNAELIQKINRSSPNEILDVLVLTKPNQKLNGDISQLNVRYQVGNIYAINAPINAIIKLSTQPNCVRIEYVKHHLKLMDDTTLTRNRIINIHTGAPPLTQPYDGTGILIGIIDSGTDFTHPDFKDASGNSRIKYLWDMTKPLATNTPTSFGYGQEWANTDIDLGLCTHSDAAYYGHGTASSGIAAGNGLAINHHQGGAPKADLMVVAMDFNRVGFTIADAVQYLVTKAQQLNKPLVINASVGDYYGSHDATDLEAQLIDNLVGNVPGKALIASAGNAGRYAFHVGYNINSNDTNFTWIQNATSQIDMSEFADTLQIKNVKYNIGVDNTGFSNLGSIGFKNYNDALNTIKRDTIYHNANRIGIVESTASINSFGVYELAITIKPDSLGYLWRIEHNGAGRIDSWNFDYVTSGLPTVAQYPRISQYKIADTLQSICSSFQCSDKVITVGNYQNRDQYIDVANVSQTLTPLAGQIALSSSEGPTRRNAVKPDIVASGDAIFACGEASTLAYFIPNAPYKVAQGGFHVRSGGTSASSPVVAGVAALYFQKNPTATSTQLKQAIINCAYSDVFTTTALPSNRWGYGKLDAFHALTCGAVTTSLNTINESPTIIVFPNPLENESVITFDNNSLKQLMIYNASASLVFSDKFTGLNYTLLKKYLAAGMYTLFCTDSNTSYHAKLIVL